MTTPSRASLVLVAASCLWSAGAGGEEFLVNQVTLGQQQVAGVAATPDHGFVVVWTSAGQDGSGAGTYARWFDRHAVPLGDEVLVNGTTASDQTAQGVATDAQGHAAVVWLSAGQDGDDLGVFARRFEPGGVPLGDEFQVNTYTPGRQQYASVAMTDTGEVVVLWSGPLAGGGLGISARRFASDGSPLGDEFVVEGPTSAYNHFATSVATTVGCAFVAAWDSDNQVWARRFDANGAALGPSFLVSTEPVFPDTYLDNLGGIAANGSGDFVVTWRRADTLESAAHYASRYWASGLARWSVQMCYWAGPYHQGMSVSSAGGLMAVWTNWYDTAVFGRRYRVDGTPLSDAEVLVSRSSNDGCSDPRIAHLGTDPEEWVLVWTDSMPDVGWDVHGLLSPTWVFSDGFESGGPAGWTSAVP